MISLVTAVDHTGSSGKPNKWILKSTDNAVFALDLSFFLIRVSSVVSGWCFVLQCSQKFSLLLNSSIQVLSSLSALWGIICLEKISTRLTSKKTSFKIKTNNM